MTMSDAAPEMQMPQPTAEHEMLMKAVGEWNVAGKFWMEGPDAPPMETTGTETVTALGGFWVEGVYKSEFMGMPFEGHGGATYDPIKQCYVTTWRDSMSPTFFHLTGQMDGDTMTCTGMGPDCMTGADALHRTVETGCGTDKRVFGMYMALPDGGELQMMELTYTRAS
jgi:hypothetical protein